MSGPMVLALLEGVKSQTRRAVKPQPHRGHVLSPCWGTSPPPNPVDFGAKGVWIENGPDYPDCDDDQRRCPYGVPGDRLWVRECHAIGTAGADQVFYRASRLPGHANTLKWRPSIFMKRAHSRITLEIVDVRVQRLQDISDDDARAEGFGHAFGPGMEFRAFDSLWDGINGEGAWRKNPWVFALTFVVVKP